MVMKRRIRTCAVEQTNKKKYKHREKKNNHMKIGLSQQMNLNNYYS